MTTLSELATAGDAIAGTSSKSEKVRLLGQFLATTDADELAHAVRYFGGSIFPAGDQRTLQVGGAAFSTVLRHVSGADDAAIRAAWRRHSDAGDVTGDLLSRIEGRESTPVSYASSTRRSRRLRVRAWHATAPPCSARYSDV